MGRFDNYLFVTDMDGTLLMTDKQVSAENRAAIDYFMANGGHFTVATGRTPSNAAKYMKHIPVNTPCVFFNGSMLYDWEKKQALRLHTLDGEIWRKFIAHCLQAFPTACIEVYTESDCNIISQEKYDDPKLIAEEYIYRHIELNKIKDLAWVKILVCAELPVLQRLEQEARKFGIMEISTSFYSASDYYEFVGKGVSKGDMVKELQQLPENQGRKIIATGDYGNDRRMLELADLGVAPVNASAEVKAVADKIGVSNDEHLIAWVINSL